jgi:hypothetical protein
MSPVATTLPIVVQLKVRVYQMPSCQVTEE